MTPGELIAKIETYYGFQCEGGPLRLCVEWQQLKVQVLAALPAAGQSPEGLQHAHIVMLIQWAEAIAALSLTSEPQTTPISEAKWPVVVDSRCKDCGTTLWHYAMSRCGACGSANLQSLVAAPAPHPAMASPPVGWQPIETASKDDRESRRGIIATLSEGTWLVGEAFCDSIGVWWWAQTMPCDGGGAIDPQPSHWMSLPAAPETDR